MKLLVSLAFPTVSGLRGDFGLGLGCPGEAGDKDFETHEGLLVLLQDELASFRGSHWPKGQPEGTLRGSNPSPREQRAM